MGLDGPKGDRESETRTAPLARPRRVDTVETIEDAGAVAFRDTGPLVRDLDAGRALGIGSDRDPNAAAAWRVLDRVVDQVDEGLAQDEAVDLRHHAVVAAHLDALALLLRENLEQRRGFPGQLEQPPLHAAEDGAGVRSREEEKAGHEARQPVYLLEHAADRLAVPLWVLVLLQRDFTHGADRGEGSPQLMRGIGGEAPELSERLLDPGQRRVEDSGQVTHLVVGVLDRKPFPKVVSGQPLCTPGHPAQGRQNAAGQPVPSEAGDRDRHRQPEQEPDRQLAPLVTETLLAGRNPDHHPATQDAMGMAQHAEGSPVP